MSLPTPITRKESYLAAIAGEEVQVPEKPITREEAYLDAIVKGGGGGEIIVDPVPTEGSTNAVSSGGTYTALEGKLDASEKGTASGVAELDANGKVLSSQLPSFVDDVVEGYYDSETDRFYEESTFETVIDPVGGKSWVDIPANKSYRWTGTVYVRVDEGVQLGETSNSAFRGDWGKTLKDTMGTGTLDTTAQTVIPAINEVKNDMPTALSDLTDDATHRLVTDTEKSTWNGKADTADITNAISALDVASVGGTGKYISEISEADGKINAVVGTMDDVPTENSNAPVKSGGIKTAIDNSVSLKTATGNPIILTDAANANAEELSMTIEPIQSGSGDPSPDNVRPISGISEAVATRTGKNLVEYSIKSATVASTGQVLVSPDFMVHVAKVVAGVTYTITSNELFVGGFFTSPPEIGSYTYNGLRIADAPRTFTAPITGYVAFRTAIDYATPQLEVGSTSTNYEAPVTPATATITFGQTVYGGSVNFKTGEVTVTHGMLDLGTLTYAYDNRHIRFISPVSGMKSVDDWGAISVFCSQYKKQSMAPGQTENNTFGIYGNSVYIRDTSYTDAATFKTAMSGVQLCYELATPTTLTLTPAELELLKGNNTITANGAEISIEYYPDNAIGALAGRVDDKADITYVDNAVSYKAGDVIANENVVAVAVGSSSNTNDCYFSIPLSKPVVATSVSVSIIACSLYYGTDQKMSITGATFTGTINKGSILVKATSENAFIQNARYVVDFNGTFTFS